LQKELDELEAATASKVEQRDRRTRELVRMRRDTTRIRKQIAEIAANDAQ
jgi:hypothetical protein